jgi:hypothetical protein
MLVIPTPVYIRIRTLGDPNEGRDNLSSGIKPNNQLLVFLLDS